MSTKTQSNPFVPFRLEYHDQPVRFVREVLGGDPDEKQSAILEAIARGDRRISVRSGHGVGKTTTLAWAIVWWICTRFPQKVLCTAPTSDQLFDALAAETKTWMKRLPAPLLQNFELMAEDILFIPAPEESFVSFRTSRADKPEALAGKHSLNMLVIGDEASGIPEAVFEASVGSMSGHEATMILAGNPVRTTGLFYETFNSMRDIWTTFHISCVGHPRVAPDFIEEVVRRYGERSNEYRVRVLGEFPLGEADTVIPIELVKAATSRDVRAYQVKPIWGVDVGRFGTDPSALAKRKGNVLLEDVKEKHGLDTMRVVGWVKAEWDATAKADRPSAICVDVIGLGAGVCDRLAELGLPAVGINVSETPSLFEERYLNQRAELWFKGRDWFAKKDCRCSDLALQKELVAPRFSYSSTGKIQVESKKDMKKRLPKIGSPNKADAFLLTLAVDSVTALGGTAGQGWSQPLKRIIRGIV